MSMEVKLFFLLLIFGVCCQANVQQHPVNENARVTAVSIQGDAQDYRFSVTLSTPDLGCEQYADWWEVVDVSGNLLYRRILTHSHVNEQPFTRSGGPVAVDTNQEVWVRLHMNNSGYSNLAMFGTPGNGFESKEFPDGFAIGLDRQVPLPDGCRF
ncbi:MAG: hypothetical protein R8G66_08730 [Cytophagales bacterium]|nr:hypothetical protein [Cytophagales bacterium]